MTISLFLECDSLFYAPVLQVCIRLYAALFLFETSLVKLKRCLQPVWLTAETVGQFQALRWVRHSHSWKEIWPSLLGRICFPLNQTFIQCYPVLCLSRTHIRDGQQGKQPRTVSSVTLVWCGSDVWVWFRLRGGLTQLFPLQPWHKKPPCGFRPACDK